MNGTTCLSLSRTVTAPVRNLPTRKLDPCKLFVLSCVTSSAQVSSLVSQVMSMCASAFSKSAWPEKRLGETWLYYIRPKIRHRLFVDRKPLLCDCGSVSDWVCRSVFGKGCDCEHFSGKACKAWKRLDLDYLRHAFFRKACSLSVEKIPFSQETAWFFWCLWLRVTHKIGSEAADRP